jgi:hypothetical protein
VYLIQTDLWQLDTRIIETRGRVQSNKVELVSEVHLYGRCSLGNS